MHDMSMSTVSRTHRTGLVTFTAWDNMLSQVYTQNPRLMAHLLEDILTRNLGSHLIVEKFKVPSHCGRHTKVRVSFDEDHFIPGKASF